MSLHERRRHGKGQKEVFGTSLKASWHGKGGGSAGEGGREAHF
jgi:hypothetical protein